jgi:hypothetical protein
MLFASVLSYPRVRADRQADSQARGKSHPVC